MNLEDALRFLVIVADKYATYLEDFGLEDCKDEVEEIDIALLKIQKLIDAFKN